MSNLIRYIQIAHADGTSTDRIITDIPEPSSYVWGMQDISGQEAGRTMTTDAWKNKVSQARTVELSWIGLSGVDNAKVLNAFNFEYAYVTLYDPEANGYVNKHFYVGDRKSELYSFAAQYSRNGGLWSKTSVKLIQAITDKV